MENQNSVCFVGKVTDIKSIDGADNIELVVVNGWNCISKKGEYEVNQLAIIATTDAIIPQSLSDEIGVTNYLRKGGRVRTIKLRGVYSECLIIPLHDAMDPKLLSEEGKDLMDELGIYKYEPPVRQVQLASGRKVKYKDNPNFHVYYKFPNFKNVPNMFTEDDVVEITRKIHGTNARYGIIKKTKLSVWDRFKKLIRVADKWVDYEFIYGSHNVEKGSDTQGFYDTDVWRTIADQYDIKGFLWKYVKSQYTTETLGTGFIVYGEIYGKGIQKNYEYGLDTIKFAGFDVELNGEYLPTYNSWNTTTQALNLPYVPILEVSNWSQELQDKYTFNQFIDGTKVPHEGIVIKHHSGDRKRVAKVINPDYHIYAEKKDVGDSH
jgi:RNA ligase (TIGR02306 family)